MTEHVKTGGSAFPSKVTIPDGNFDPFSGKTAQGNHEYIQMGMTLRDYFAAKAIQGLLASEVRASDEQFAEYSYKVADAMLRAREGVK